MEKWEGWEESSLWRMTTRREEPGEKVRSQTRQGHAAQDVSQLGAVTKIYRLRGDEATWRLWGHSRMLPRSL